MSNMRLFFTKIIYFLNIFFTFFGLKVLTKKELNLHLNLKKNAVFELTKLYKGDRDKGLIYHPKTSDNFLKFLI